MTTKIALVGKARSGKDTAALYLANIYDFSCLAFGDSLKYFAHSLFPWISGEPKPRNLYTSFGQAMRNLGVEGAEDIWIRHTMQKVANYERWGLTEKILISDCRQPNEYERLKAEGFTIIRITSHEALRIERMRAEGDSFSVDDLQHETEQHVEGFDVDYQVTNNGDKYDLYEQLDKVMTELGVKKFQKGDRFYAEPRPIQSRTTRQATREGSRRVR